MNDPEQVRMLIQAAERDLSALRGMRDVDVFADEIFGFHVQQAVEKSFKAWLALLGETYPTTHNLARLLEALRARDPEAARFKELIEYTPYAVRLRYVGAEPRRKPLDRSAILQRVEALLERVRRSMEGG